MHAPDAWFLKRGLTPAAVHAPRCAAHAFTSARRRGKLILVDVDSGAVLGLHLGMSGRVLVDDEAAGDPLLLREQPGRSRVAPLRCDLRRRGHDVPARPASPGRGRARSRRGTARPRRVRPDPRPAPGDHREESCTGEGGDHGPVPNRRAREPAVRRDPVAGGHRSRPAGRRTRRRRGDAGFTERSATRCGSSVAGADRTPAISPLRERPGLHCPRDGAPLLRRTVGGRTTYSCPVHQV